jgi:outer membrane protein TolC
MLNRSIWTLICGAVLWGQTTPPEAVPPSDRAVQLPISGRTGRPGSVVTVQNPLPTGLQSVNTITSTVQVQGAYQGSVPSGQTPGPSLALSLDEAIRRGLQFNLGVVGYENSVRQAQALQTVARSALLPYVASDFLVVEQQISLPALGFSGNVIPGVPSVIGPFHYFDARAGVAQNVLDLTKLRNYRASKENVRGTRLAADDARDLITLAVTGAYLQIISAGARVDAVRAEVATADETWRQARDRLAAGLSPLIDETRTRVELQTQQQRLIAVINDLAKLKIVLGRLIGLPPGQEFTLSDTLPYAPLTSITLDDALARAYANRADLKSAASQVRAAELTRRAAAAERYPTVAARADYGAIGSSPARANGTFGVAGQVNFPIFQGGRVNGDIQEAEAALAQRRAEYQDLRGQIDAEVRTALLDLTSAASQVGVAVSNRGLARETLKQARDRFAAGITDTLEVVQAEQTVAAAARDYISALYAHNVAKATLARAMGQARQNMRQFLPRP